MDFGPYSAVTRVWNSAEWEFQLDFHRRYVEFIGYEAWQSEIQNRHFIMMEIFDQVTSALDCTSAGAGMTEQDKSLRRELCVRLSIQHFQFMKMIQDVEFARKFGNRELAFVEATCFQQINRELDQVYEFFLLVFQLLKVYWNSMRDSCRNGLHAASCGTGNGRGGTAMSEEEHRRRMDELRRREEEAKRRQREAREKLDRMEKLRRQKLNPDQDVV